MRQYVYMGAAMIIQLIRLQAVRNDLDYSGVISVSRRLACRNLLAHDLDLSA